MSQDFWVAFVRQALMAFFSSAAMQQYVTGDQATSIALGAGALVTLGFTLYARYNTRPVHVLSVVTNTAATPASAKALSISEGK